jgi:hypothetical protein
MNVHSLSQLFPDPHGIHLAISIFVRHEPRNEYVHSHEPANFRMGTAIDTENSNRSKP